MQNHFKSRSRGQNAPRRQRGFLMLEVSLALLLALIAAGAAFISTQRATDATNAVAQADSLQFFREAAETLVESNYIQFQAGQSVTSNSVTLAFGTNPGQALQPTTANLKSMGLGVDNAAEQGFYKSLTNANYQVNIQRVPVGCNLAPNPANGVLCNIIGTVCFTQPVQAFGSAAADTDGFAIGKMLGRLGGNGGVSIEGIEANITGTGGSWSTPNPIAGTPAGIVCSRFGFGSSGLANFLRINDTRDLGFKGGMTLDGTNASGNALQVNGTATVAGPLNVGGATALNGNIDVKDGSGNSCVKIWTAGQIDINCNGVLNSKLGMFTAANGTVYIGDGNPGGLYTISTTGAIYAGRGLNSARGGIFSDTNPTGVNYATKFTGINGSGVTTLSLNGTGAFGSAESVSSGYFGLNRVVVVGSACGGAGVVVPGTDAGVAASTALASLTNGGVASCIGGKWTAIAAAAVPGSACAPDGVSATSTIDGRALVCRNGVYMQVADLLSRFVLMTTYRVTDGSLISKPICGQLGAGVGQPISILTAQVESSSSSSFNRRTEDANATTWRVILQDASGTSLSGAPNAEALLYSYCYY